MNPVRQHESAERRVHAKWVHAKWLQAGWDNDYPRWLRERAFAPLHGTGKRLPISGPRPNQGFSLLQRSNLALHSQLVRPIP